MKLRLALLALLGLCACTSPGTPSEASDGALRGKLVLTGSSTVAPVAGELARAFEAEHPRVRIDVQTGGSSRGVADVRRGLADLGMISRSLRDSESDLRAHTVARDGICLIVHADNPLHALADAEIVAIYRGERRRWSDFGGAEREITVVHKAAGRSTLELFLAHFGLEAGEVRPQVVIGDNEQGLKTIAGNPDAIGYVSIGAAEHSRALGVPIRLLPLEGVDPAPEQVASGDYPLARPLQFVWRGEATPLAESFLAFTRSDAAQSIIRAQSLVPVSG